MTESVGFEPEALDSLAESGARLTLRRVDGVEATGTIVALDGGRYKVATGKRGRPLTFAPEDVDTVVVHAS